MNTLGSCTALLRSLLAEPKVQGSCYGGTQLEATLQGGVQGYPYQGVLPHPAVIIHGLKLSPLG